MISYPKKIRAALCCLLPGLLFPEMLRAATPLETLEQTSIEWVRLRAQSTQLENEWITQRDLMEATARSLEQRATAAEAKRDNLQAKTATDRREIATLEAKNQTANEGLLASEVRVKKLQERLVQLRPSLPPRLSSSLDLAYRSLANPDLPLGERMQLTMTVLNRSMQFNRSVFCGEEALNPDNEPKSKLLTVIYWGLSRGYALDRTAGKAWLGSPGPEGWRWEAHPEAAAQVAELISVYNDKAEPHFLTVPASLLHPATAAANR